MKIRVVNGQLLAVNGAKEKYLSMAEAETLAKSTGSQCLELALANPGVDIRVTPEPQIPMHARPYSILL